MTESLSVAVCTAGVFLKHPDPHKKKINIGAVIIRIGFLGGILYCNYTSEPLGSYITCRNQDKDGEALTIPEF